MAAWLAPGCAAAAAGGVDVDEHGSTQPPGLGGMPVAVESCGRGRGHTALVEAVPGHDAQHAAVVGFPAAVVNHHGGQLLWDQGQ